MFQLLDPTRATITSVTLRREMHGDDRVPATSIGLKIVAPNTLLDELSPGMMAMFYQAAKEPPDEPEFAEVESASRQPRKSGAAPVHGIIKPMWLSVDGGIKPYGPVCKQCYGEWIVRSLPTLQTGLITEA